MEHFIVAIVPKLPGPPGTGNTPLTCAANLIQGKPPQNSLAVLYITCLVNTYTDACSNATGVILLI